MTRRWRLIGSTTIALFAFLLVFGGTIVDRSLNRVTQNSIDVTADTLAFHRSLLVADMHADALLWKRDLRLRSRHGHVDLPRLREGNVGLVGFTVVTKVPFGQNIHRTDDRADVVTLLSLLNHWPRSTWRSLNARALVQATEFRELSEDISSKLRVIRTREDLEQFLRDRAENAELIGGFLGLEGAHALEGEIDHVDALFNAGYRMMAPTHFFDNRLSGSAHGVRKGPLTEFGRRAIVRMQELGILVDVAHASEAAIDDIVSMSIAPIVSSHGGVKGTCNNPRNLSDRHIQAIAKSGGLVSIGYWKTAICGENAHAIAKAIRYVTDLVGIDHVALGSDYDGSVVVPFDAAGTSQITQALIEQGFSTGEMKKILGLNSVRVLRRTLPAR